MHASTSGPAISRNCMRSVLAITISVLGTTVALLPFAVAQSGSGGPLGLAAAAAICLMFALLSESLVGLLHSSGSPSAALLAGMAVRNVPILSACLIFAALGFRGREHLALISYFLAFYFVTLVVETCLALKRVAGKESGHTSDRAGAKHG